MLGRISFPAAWVRRDPGSRAGPKPDLPVLLVVVAGGSETVQDALIKNKFWPR